jgi:primosomal protein N' (replication factor Y)
VQQPELTAEQSTALAAIDLNAGFSAHLLHGVTGSGKTEVYLRLIARALAAGQQVLLLVPEINLTPQLEGRVRARFPEAGVVSLHSELAEAARERNWRAAFAGEASIVLGTRLAIFTPLPRLGLIVIDEEHDSSFKQQDGMRYSARDVGVFRARQLAIPILLGSATPALESWANAQSKRYNLLTLRQRANPEATLPAVHLLDTRKMVLKEGVSEPLIAAIKERLARGEQSLSSSIVGAMRRCWPAWPAAGFRAVRAVRRTWCCIWPIAACAATTAAVSIVFRKPARPAAIRIFIRLGAVRSGLRPGCRKRFRKREFSVWTAIQ